MTKLFSGLRQRLILLVLLAALPALGLILYTNLEQRDLAAANAQAEALRLARLTVAEEEQLIQITHQLLIALAQLPVVQARESATCSKLFANLVQQFPAYGNLGAAGLDGDIYCSGLSFSGSVNIRDRRYFQQAIETNDFAVGDYQTGRITGKPGLNFGYPLHDDTGQVQGVVFIALDLDWLNRLLAQAELPPGSTFSLIDHRGVILAHQPDSEVWVGRSVLNSPLTQTILAQGEGIVAESGPDGVRRLYAFTPLASAAPTEAGEYVSIGFPTEAIFAEANRMMVRNLTLLGLVTVVAFIAAWLGGDLFLLRQIKALLGATEQLAAGDLAVRSGVSYGRGELGQLARAFDRMAEALAQRQAELRRVNRALRTVSECNQALVRATTESELTHEICQIIVAVGEYRLAWIGLAEQDEYKTVQPVAQAGFEAGYLETLDITWADTGRGRGPTGTAIRTGRPAICKHIATEADYAPWRQEALRRGYASSIALPLIADDLTIGALNLYAAEPAAFDGEEVKLLAELADDVAYGITNLRRRAERHQAEAALRESEYFIRTIISSVGEGIVVYDRDLRYRLWNKSMEDLTGVPAQEVLGKPALDLFPHLREQGVDRLLQQALAGETAYSPDTPYHVPATGKSGWVRGVYSPHVTVGGEVIGVVATIRDITASKQADEELKQRAAQLALLNNVGSQIAATLELTVVLNTAAHLIQEMFDYHHVALFLIEGEALKLKAVAGSYESYFPPGHTQLLNQGINGWVASHGEIIVANDVAAEQRYISLIAEHTVTQAELCLPIKLAGQTVGVLDIQSPNPNAFSDNDVVALEAIAGQIAVAIDNAQLYAQAQQELEERKRAEATLAEERNLLRTLIDNLPDFIYVKDVESRFVVNNLAHVHALGATTPAEIIGKTDLDLFPRELAEQYYADERVVISSGQAILDQEEVLEDQRTGNRIWVSVTKVPLRDQQGNIIGLVGISRDVTARKQAEQELVRRNRELELLNAIIAASASGMEAQTILETACRHLALAFDLPQAVAVLLDEQKTEAQVVAEYRVEGRPETLNQTILVAGNPSFQYLLTRQASLVVEEDVQTDPHLASIRELLRQGSIAALLILPLIIESEVVGALVLEATKPRHFSPEEVSLAWSVADQVAGALARLRLDAERQLLSAAVEQTTEGVVILDPDRTIRYANPAFERMTGYSRTEAIGQELDILHSGKHEPVFFEEILATITTGRVWQGRIINRKKDGTLYTDETVLAPVRNEQGEIVNYVELKRDVTQMLELEEQYRQAQKMEAIGHLTGGIAHDFNNLLTAINGFAELLQVRLPPDSPYRRMVDNIVDPGRRAAKLVSQLLAFSRKQVIDLNVLDLNTVVDGMDKMLRRIIGEDVILTTLLTPELWPIKADSSQLEQVILNLAVNARDAMPHGGRLTIETANLVLDEAYVSQHFDGRPGEYVLLAVSDTGAGMSQEVQAHIFEPFFTTKEKGKGTGLGLATVFGIVKQSGGDIRVYSEPDLGTTFKIYLPRTDEAVVDPTLRKSDLVPYGTETILLVEDDPNVHQLVREVLQGLGYTLLEAADAQAALALADRYTGPLHLLLTDVIMPGLNGKALADQMVQSYPDLKILFMSGYTDNAIVHHGVLEPDLAFIQKPFSADALARKVREVLDTSPPHPPDPLLPRKAGEK